MPSLYGTDVSANYGRVTHQVHVTDKDGNLIGQPFTNFGTRQLRLIKVVAVDDGAAIDFTDATHTSMSVFSNAVRAIQTVAEVFGVFIPGTAGFIAVIAEDTTQDGIGAFPETSADYTALETAIVAALKQSVANGGAGLAGVITATVTRLDVDATGIAFA
jgi:hypothetical protein